MTGLGRRGLLASATAMASLAVARGARAQARVGGEMRQRALAFLEALGTRAAGAACFGFDDGVRRRWNFMGTGAKPGLPLERMDATQKGLALDLLATGLSADGMRKAERVMVLQDVLREQGRGPSDRNRERFSFAVFGPPADDADWGWRVEGHHLSLSYTLVDDEVVSVTPSSFSSDPNVVASGSHAGLVALVEEEDLARMIYADLTPNNRRRALIAETAFGNILATARREARFGSAREGVPLAELAPAQTDLIERLIEVYAVDHLAAPLAADQRARLAAVDRAATHFAWAGSDRPGEMLYYRLHGDGFVIEFASLRNQPLHLHTVRHDLERNLGAHALT